MSEKRQTEISTREYLGTMANRGWKFLFKTTPLIPKKVLDALAKVEKKFGDSTSEFQAKVDLDALAKEVRKHWEEKRELGTLLRKTFRKIPFILFYPRDHSQDWLGGNDDFCQEFGEVLQERDYSPRVVSILLHQFIISYPTGLGTFSAWRKFLGKALTRAEGVRILDWKSRVREFHLLDQDGPKKMAETILASSEPTARLLVAGGFAGELSSCEFLLNLQESMLESVSKVFEEDEPEETVVRRLLEFLEAKEGVLRFKGTEARIAEGLLKPWVDWDPPDPVQDLLREFFLRHLGHPQLKAGNWYSISEPAKNVMERWLIKITLEDFFRLVDDTAQDSHWRYRRAFWEAYLSRGVISKARLLLGPGVQHQARRFLRMDISSCGRVDGVGVQANHSVLLLQIGHLIVTEWSHMGKCRFWPEDSRWAPNFSQTRYDRIDLVQGPEFEFPHLHSETGSWQRKCAAYINHEIGIHIETRELMRGVE